MGGWGHLSRPPMINGGECGRVVGVVVPLLLLLLLLANILFVLQEATAAVEPQGMHPGEILGGRGGRRRRQE